jgi:peptidoglycan/xylan/chitin deacetylase (PgdA/CDA1 family)
MIRPRWDGMFTVRPRRADVFSEMTATTGQRQLNPRVDGRREKVRKAERAARILQRGGIGGLARRVGSWTGVLVLNYHRVGTPDGNGFEPDLYSADAESFAAQAQIVARHFDVVGPDDLIARPKAPGRRVLITFDDGYRDNYEVALPVLRMLGIPASFFVIPGYIDEPVVAWWDEIAWMLANAPADRLELPQYGLGSVDLTDEREVRSASAGLAGIYKTLPGSRTATFLDTLGERTGAGRAPADLARDTWMTWDQVRELQQNGMTIGGHTLTHPILARHDRATQEREVEGCAQRLREELGTEMDSFSYPVGLAGTFDATTRDVVARAGVKIAFGFSGGYQPEGVRDRFDVPRAGVSHNVSPERFAAMVTLPQLFARW